MTATAEREIVLSRLIDAPPELVFEAFTEVRHLSRWWGPHGFRTTTRSLTFNPGLSRLTTGAPGLSFSRVPASIRC